MQLPSPHLNSVVLQPRQVEKHTEAGHVMQQTPHLTDTDAPIPKPDTPTPKQHTPNLGK